MCCTQLSCGPWQPKGPFIKDIQRYPKSRKMRTRGRGCLVNLDILFKMAFSGPGLVLIVAQAFPAFGVFLHYKKCWEGLAAATSSADCRHATVVGERACSFSMGGGLTDKRTSAGLGGSKESRKIWTRGRGSKSPQILRTSFMNGPQSDLSEDDCPENYYYYYSSQWDDLSLLPRLQEQTSSLIGYGLPHWG